jgi:hypothetical protein
MNSKRKNFGHVDYTGQYMIKISSNIFWSINPQDVDDYRNYEGRITNEGLVAPANFILDNHKKCATR